MTYPIAFKRKVVEFVKTNRCRIIDASREFKVNPTSVKDWVDQYDRGWLDWGMEIPTSEEKEAIVTYVMGSMYSLNEIAKHWHRPKWLIRKILRDKGVRFMYFVPEGNFDWNAFPPDRISIEKKDAIIEYVKKHPTASMTELGQQFYYSPTTIWKILKRRGVERRYGIIDVIGDTNE
jgi:transposase